MEEPKDYSLIEDGVVTNVIWLCESNAGEFPGAVCISDRPVTIGDQYAEGVFLRDGNPVLTYEEIAALAVLEVPEEIEPE